mgnify:CR=1 FL=1
MCKFKIKSKSKNYYVFFSNNLISSLKLNLHKNDFIIADKKILQYLNNLRFISTNNIISITANEKTKDYQIRLVLREGELLSELNKEVKRENFDIAIVGSPNRKRMIHQLAQFLDTSIFFVKNFNPSWDYKILLCVDDSRATKRAVILSTRISKQFSSEIKNMTVSKTTFFGKGYRNAHQWAERYLKRMDVSQKLGQEPLRSRKTVE